MIFAIIFLTLPLYGASMLTSIPCIPLVCQDTVKTKANLAVEIF